MSQHSKQGEFTFFDASGYRVGIVVAQFNRDICEALLESALTVCKQYGIPESNIVIHRVAGSVEIPVVLKKMAETKKYDCLLALGVIIRGDTPHFDYVAKLVSEGVLRVTLDHTISIGFGVLTLENESQAEPRISVGGSSMVAALQTAKIVKEEK